MNHFSPRLEATVAGILSTKLSVALVAIDAITPDSTQMLTCKEQEAWNRYQLAKRKNEFLAGRIAAKLAVGYYDNPRWKKNPQARQVEIKNRPDGRPFLAWREANTLDLPDLSISHSGNYGVAMVAAQPCGIDIQQKSGKLTGLREKFVTAYEPAIFDNQATPPSLPSRLNILWAAKEALKKAVSFQQMPGFLDLTATNCVEIDRDIFHLTFQLIKSGHSPRTLPVCAAIFASEYSIAFSIDPSGNVHA